MIPSERIAPPAAAANDGPQLTAMREYRMPAKVFHWLTAILVVFMVSSAVIAKQLNDGPVSDLLFRLHKLTGALTLFVVLLRLCYRLLQRDEPPALQAHRRSRLHWTLYGIVVLVPLLGWAGISDFGAREIFPGYSLPAIWPEHAGHADLLFALHAYLAFALLAVVAVHIGVAMQDYMLRAHEQGRRD